MEPADKPKPARELNQALTIGDIRVEPGQRRSIELEVGRLYTHSPTTMPVQVICGKRAGPVLFVSAAIHGDELNGVEIIRRLLKLKELNKLRGSLVAVPIVNLHGFIHTSRYLPDRRDLNRSFPGSEKGSLAARVAHLFMREIVSQATHGIDLHTGAIHRANLPQIRADLDNPDTLAMAKAFGTPVILNAALRDGSLRAAAMDKAIPMLLYEAGEALRLDELSIRGGVEGVLRVMRMLGMLSSKRRKSPPEPVMARSSSWVRAPQSGLFLAEVPLGARVTRDQTVLGVVSDPFGEKAAEIKAPFSGIVIGRLNLPLVNEGDAVYHIARFWRTDLAAERWEDYQESLENGEPGL
ncbi:MAG: succinylglutamate desuccinylase/aspartoacylase family protein [Wenzhouxiangella sp.]|nr:succinylglutamate desuccinylase/aspartoacylase family protein [Wenzhouxiangella sp.]TVR94026.1 MAG: succinylglutamate desuccinylase [Wenzhouxiangellaceae bacterium]